MGRNGSGVELREKSIRISFTWRDMRCRETLDRPPTEPNRKYAERLVAEIRRKIAIGSFDYAAYFPDSPRAQQKASNARTFGQLCKTYLQTKGRLAKATLSQYDNALKFWQLAFGVETSIDELTHGTIAAFVGSHPWASAKLCNNYLIPLRGVFALAGREIKGLENPLEGIENARHQKADPDPLSIHEMERILADMAKHYDDQVASYFEFAFLTGMRPEELIALRWSDIDWNHGTIKVERARTFRGEVKDLKTYVVRNVDLVERAIAVLKRQKPHTYLKSPEIFQNPLTQKPWHDERSQRDHYWQPSLRRLGIRMRRAYQTRHTYATTALMAGVNPSYVSRQMGHRSAKMLFSVYSKWIDSADRGREKAKMEGVLGTVDGAVMAQNSGG